jgi:hypothetical protein
VASQIALSFAETIYNGLLRRSLVDCARWAEKCRVMGKPYPGNYNFLHFPWAREMHNANCEEWCGQKSAQMGFTEVALNRTFYTIDIKRVDCLYLLPAQNPDASQFSAGRFNPALEMSPYLKNLFSEVSNVGHKRAGACNLYVRGSRSRSSLKAIPVGLIIFDELDEMTMKNLPLADERQAGQIERQRIKISTPTITGRGINLEFFPDCLVITGESIFDPKLDDSHLICKECKAVLEHETKHEWLAGGIWQPNFRTYKMRGFHINQLYSSTESPVKIANKFLKAQDDQTEEQEFWNSTVGQVHEVKGGRVQEVDFNECKKNYAVRETIPQGTLVTMGIDQGTHLHYECCAWYPVPLANVNTTDINLRFRPRLIDYGKLFEFEELDKLMIKWEIRGCVIDIGPERRKALEFARRFDGLVYACVYGEGVNGRELVIWSNQPTVTVDRTTWLDLSLGRFHNHTISLPHNIDDEYSKQIREPVRKPEKDKHGNPIARYVTGERKPDHYAHSRNYCEIALSFAAQGGQNKTIRSPR